jgi:hypothetical protein
VPKVVVGIARDLEALLGMYENELVAPLNVASPEPVVVGEEASSSTAETI